MMRAKNMKMRQIEEEERKQLEADKKKKEQDGSEIATNSEETK